MGSGRWNPDDYAGYAKTTKGKTTDDIYKTHDRVSGAEVPSELNPHGVKLRESRDSTDNPNSNAIIVALDVTGSMQMVLDVMARKSLGTLFEGILEREPVSDPHIMFMGIGDVQAGDTWPLQVSQFEASNVIIEQLTGLYLEKGGGSNDSESYNLAWYFAAMHTSIDCMEKRGKKGYLFTVGDERAPATLRPEHLKRVLGYAPQKEVSATECLAMAQKMYNVFHVVVEETHTARSDRKAILSTWRELLGQNVLLLEDHSNLSEVIVSAIQVVEGRDSEEVASSWKGGTSVVVRKAIGGLVKSNDTGGLTTL